jgi:GNAT superfamily N-acetyltransferase
MRLSPEIRVERPGPADRPWVRALLEERWGAPIVVTCGRVHLADELPAFVARLGHGLAGLITYRIAAPSPSSGSGGAEGTAEPGRVPECEVVTLDSVQSGLGIGSRLLEAVKSVARSAGCRRVWLITTNDNLRALAFYQKRGFELVAVRRGAIARSRMIKPSIPLLGIDGIPIRDEIELEVMLA